MYAVSLWRPWDWAIFNLPRHCAKRVENRSWRPSPRIVGTRIAIHAGVRFDMDGAAFIEKVARGPGIAFPNWRTRAIERAPGICGTALLERVASPAVTPITLDDSQKKWAFGPYCWMLRDVVRFRAPIPCKGRQKFWRLSGEILEQALEAEIDGIRLG